MPSRVLASLGAGVALLAVSATAQAQGVLTVAMTAGDIPVTTGNPDQGFEGFRFVALNLYDALINWDLSKSDTPAVIKPGLATEWHVDEANPRRWIFKLRSGVKWHDGCPFTADDVVWNFGRFDEKAPQWNPQQFALSRAYLPNFAGVEKIDDSTVALTTKVPSSLFPYEMSFVVMTSRCRAEALKYDWNALANQPSGTGPYKFDRMVAHERLEFVPNPEYWDKARIPKQDRLVLLPMPEASTRTAALLSGQVNFVEAPTPDAIPRLKSAGMNVITNFYPHNWSYQLNFVNGPFKDKRVRQAANYALNRADFVELLGGVAIEGPADFPPSSPWYGKPMLYKYDLAKAKSLLQQAGCLPCKITLAISTSGSGQMQPLPMNELLKSQLEEAGFQVNFKVMDWNALLALARGGVDTAPDVDGINVSRAVQDPINGMTRFMQKVQWSPNGGNWGHYHSEKAEQLISTAFNEFDPAKRDEMLRRVHEFMVDEAVMIWVVHDLNPRALSPKVQNFVQAQSWFQDLTPITVAK
ncbi:MAG TPA: ABC transporter substrate-binding protein [Acetobacteraceae bacterium]|nr:ABC transporter substrate-binding protein [Acetobacteraceae bacterium]